MINIMNARINKQSKSKKTKASEKTIIGWTVKVTFSDWNIPAIYAKVDTGAKTSALHVENLEALPDGKIRFDVIIGRHRPFLHKRVCTRPVRWARVRSSTGHYTHRYVVRTLVQIGSVKKEIEVTLVSREFMQYRMLLGRSALKRDFLINVSRRDTLNTKPKRKRPPDENRNT